MKTLLFLCAITGAMSAQDFHGISIADGPKDPESGAVMPLVVNATMKTLVGFAVQTDIVTGVVGFESLARGTGIRPGERRPMPGLGMFSTGEGETRGYAIRAVLFDDMSYFGPDGVFRDFSHRIETIRSMALDVQYSKDKLTVLEQHKAGGVPTAASVDTVAIQHRASMASILLMMREDEMEAALARLAALPDVVKGEEK